MTDVQPVAYEPGRRGELVELMASVWGDPEAGENIEWWFDASPVQPGLICLAEIDGRLAGTLGFSFLRVLVDGRPLLAAVPLRAASREEFRGRGVFSRLVAEGELECRRRGAELGLTMANEASRPVFLRHGWRELRGRRVWVRPRRACPSPTVADRLGPRRYAGVSIEAIDRFDAGAEEAGRLASPLYGDHVIAAADYLNWRYVDAPHAYRCFGAGAEGYAVVRRMREWGLETGMICTVVAATARVTRALLARCADELRGVQLLAGLRPPAHTAAWLAAGFVPSPRTMAPLGKPLRAGISLPSAPALQFGDYDFV